MALFNALASLALLSESLARSVEISNVEPRRDVSDQLMDVHDGKVVQWSSGGLYYWYGMGYKNCSLETGLLPPRACPGIYHAAGHCGFRNDHAINIFSSADLVNWSFEGEALPIESRPTGIYFRPKVVFNKQSGEYVLWVNIVPPAFIVLKSYVEAGYVVATATSPAGPFKVVTERAAMQFTGGGDFDLLVDKSGAAYIAYDAWSNSHTVVVEQLTDDYHDSLGTNATTGKISSSSNEAEIFFERNGWYYLLFGHTCCFCKSGSNAAVWVAQHPLGPWTSSGIDIGGKPGFIDGGTSYTHTQQSSIIQVGLEGGDTAYVWVGDRWGSAPDGLKSHDFQFWQPLVFNDSAVPPTIAKTHWVDNFTLALPAAFASVVV